MKILHTNFLKGWGGQSNRILVECEGLASRGHDVLLSVPPGSELAKRARARGLAVDESVRYASGLRLEAFRDIGRMRTVLKRFPPDVVHLHGGRDSWAVAAATLWRTRPAIVRTKHNIFTIVGHPFNRWLYGRFFQRIVCLSHAIIDQCVATGYISPDKLRLIPSAAEPEKFQVAPGTRERIRTELGIGADTFVVAMTGRLRPEKGHDVLLAAAPAIIRGCPNVRFLLLGSGSQKGEFQSVIGQNQLEQHIIMTGFRNDVPECLSAANLYVQPSRSEGLGTAVIEACCAGLPVVASRSGGIPDIIKDGSTGLLVDVGDAEQLATAVLRLVTDSRLRETLGRAAQEFVERNFSIPALIEKTEAVYRELV
ncbi:MAG: glycosyltransferase family 4 protein [Candidatus Sumerlaeaceae bacterium]|nr:glycosyltransferase family 4 protein [Candidatus Sumerlaeaceae bacterium]